MPDSRPNRVLHVITQLIVGGAERQLFNLCRLMPRDRFENAVVSLIAGGVLIPDFREIGCTVFEVDRRHTGGAAGQLLEITRLIREWRPDLIQTWLLKGNHVGRLAGALSANAPMVAGFRDMGFGAGPGDTFVDRLLSPATTLILHNSRGGRRAHLGRLHECGGARHGLLPNGVDENLFGADAEARAEIRAERGLAADTPVVIMVARLQPIKNPDLFIDVARRVRGQRPDAQFWLVGGGPEHGRLRALLETDPDPGIWLAGERFDVPRLLAAADLALLTSRSEGLSNTILEAMASGLPVIATDVGGNGELVTDGENGYLVPVQEAEAIAARIHELLQNLPLAEMMGRRGREILEARYSMSSLVDRAGDYYERVIRGG